MVDTQRPPILIDGLSVHSNLDSGDTRVVMVHGAMDRGAAFIKTIRRLDELDVVRYDRRGYGRSVGAGVCEDFEGHVEDLVSVIDGRPAVVIGHSFGGLIALAAAQRRPDLVRSVGVFEAPTPWAPWWPASSAGANAFRAGVESGPAEAAEHFMRAVIGDRRWDRLSTATREARRLEGPALLGDMGAVRDGAPYEIRLINQPVLAGHGGQSGVHHCRAADELAEMAETSDLVVIAGASHNAHVSHPEEFAQFVRHAARMAPSTASTSSARHD